jgi:hypothetical protein
MNKDVKKTKFVGAYCEYDTVEGNKHICSSIQ